MRRNRRLAGLVLSATIFFLTGCGGSEQALPPAVLQPREKTEVADRPFNTDAIRIGVSLQGLQRPYIQRLGEALGRVERELDGAAAFTILDGLESAEKQNAQIERSITSGVDIIIFNPISFEEGALGVELANEAGIPIVLLTTTVSNMEQTQAQAISDHKESALIQIDMVAEHLGDSGKIVILEGLSGITSQIYRTEGYREALQNYANIQVVEQQSANWTRMDAYVIVENWIRLGKQFDAVVAQNDNMALGALQAVQEAGMAEQIAVFGIDGDEDALESIQRGGLTGTVYHNAERQVRLAVDQAVRLYKDEEVDSVPIPFAGIDRANVSTYIRLLDLRGQS